MSSSTCNEYLSFTVCQRTIVDSQFIYYILKIDNMHIENCTAHSTLSTVATKLIFENGVRVSVHLSIFFAHIIKCVSWLYLILV